MSAGLVTSPIGQIYDLLMVICKCILRVCSARLPSSEGAYIYFTDPEIPNPLGSHDLSTFVGVIPYTRQPANDSPDSFTQTAIVSLVVVMRVAA